MIKRYNYNIVLFLSFWVSIAEPDLKFIKKKTRSIISKFCKIKDWYFCNSY